MMIFRTFLVFAVSLILFPLAVGAQQTVDENAEAAPVTPAVEQVAETAPPLEEEQPQKPLFDPQTYQSLVFTHWEHVAIEDARDSRGKTRSVTEAELTRDLKNRDDPSEKIKPPPEEREIRLAGIVYHGGKDWTIWLNEQRVTPDAVPEEVMDLKVYKTYIEFKWFDNWTNQIFPIRLRPHQRFNIDTRIFLPG